MSKTAILKTQEIIPTNTTSKSNSIVVAIGNTLLELIKENSAKPNFKERVKAQSKQIFTSRSLPKITLTDYIHRILKYTKIEVTTLTLALIYIDRLCKKNKMIVTEYNSHRLLFGASLIAIKYNEDKFYSNVYYAKIGGLDITQLNTLELEFAMGINFDLFVDNKTFEKYESILLRNSN